MINKKKIINKIRIENLLKEYPIIFLLQHNNFTVNDWFVLKQKIQEIQNPRNDHFRDKSPKSFVELTKKTKTIEILYIKNNLVKKAMTQNNCNDLPFKTPQMKLEFLNFLFQGPNFIIGCKDENHLKSIWNCINLNSKLIFISCFHKNEMLNHLDLELLLKTNSSVYQTLLHNLDKKTEISNVLKNSFETLTNYSSPLQIIQSNLITILSQIR